MTLPWVEAQIEETLRSENSAKNVYDLAMLCIARDELVRRAASEYSQKAEPSDKKRDDAVVLTAYSADLDTVPTIEQIDKALGSVSVRSKADRQRVKELKTWKDIIAN